MILASIESLMGSLWFAGLAGVVGFVAGFAAKSGWIPGLKFLSGSK